MKLEREDSDWRDSLLRLICCFLCLELAEEHGQGGEVSGDTVGVSTASEPSEDVLEMRELQDWSSSAMLLLSPRRSRRPWKSARAAPVRPPLCPRGRCHCARWRYKADVRLMWDE